MIAVTPSPTSMPAEPETKSADPEEARLRGRPPPGDALAHHRRRRMRRGPRPGVPVRVVPDEVADRPDPRHGADRAGTVRHPRRGERRRRDRRPRQPFHAHGRGADGPRAGAQGSHRIAHREFLQALRSQRPHTSLEAIAEPPSPPAADWSGSLELRDAIRKLPVEEGEVVVLHYLHGYSCQEIAQIVRAPVTTVKYRLMAARAHLQRELGEGDLVYLNPPSVPMQQWAWLPLDRMRALEARLSMVQDHWLRVDRGERTMSDKTHAGMSRRKLLEAAGTAAAAVAAGPAAVAAPAPNEADVIDGRLARSFSADNPAWKKSNPTAFFCFRPPTPVANGRA